MKLTAIRCLRLTGAASYGATEERKVDLLDRIPGFSERKPPNRTPGRKLSAVYVQVDTDSGTSGLFGPVFEETAALVRAKIAPLLTGRDPRDIDALWNLMYAQCWAFGSGGSKGYPMMAISAVDLALWDLRGRLTGQPVCQLLGRPVREYVPCYASMLGFSLEPARVRERAQDMVRRGYHAQKWFFRYGPGDGEDGFAKNVALVRNVREAVGDEIKIMFDCSMAWDPDYTKRVLEHIVDYRPYWVEEPLTPDGNPDLAAIRQSTKIPLAAGEHEYTRWGFRQLLDTGAVDVLQPDPEWCGGITETLRICTLATGHARSVYPHGHSISGAWNLVAAQPESLCPMLEYLWNFQPMAQHFHKSRVEPLNGMLPAPVAPGLGIVLDEAKIERCVEF